MVDESTHRTDRTQPRAPQSVYKGVDQLLTTRACNQHVTPCTQQHSTTTHLLVVLFLLQLRLVHLCAVELKGLGPDLRVALVAPVALEPRVERRRRGVVGLVALDALPAASAVQRGRLKLERGLVARVANVVVRLGLLQVDLPDCDWRTSIHVTPSVSAINNSQRQATTRV